MDVKKPYQTHTSSKRRGVPPKILVVGPSWIADIVLTNSLLQLLVERYRNALGQSCDIDVLAPGWSAALFKRMPEVRRIIDMPLGHGKMGLGLRRQLGQSLRFEGYDKAIVLPNSFKSAIVPFAAKIPERVGWRGEMRYALLNDVRVLNEAECPRLIQRYAALALSDEESLPETIPTPRLSLRAEQAVVTAKQLNLDCESLPVIAICPRADGSELRPGISLFSEEQYGELISRLLAKKVNVWLLGNEKQVSFADAILRSVRKPLYDQKEGETRAASTPQVGTLTNLVGKTDLSELLDLLSIATVTVSDDKGLKLASVAMGCPTLGIELNELERKLFAIPNLNHYSQVTNRSIDEMISKVGELLQKKGLAHLLMPSTPINH